MPKNKKDRAAKPAGKQDASFHNDQLGENASEQFSNKYDNKQNKKK